ncbi:unnamed protein product [Knipowitschia caucasica]|uniref:Active regulator of SIRT1 n=1 Tax=Knipowitschia caucasica TaxID=637954 RepID=A0AAV2LKC4_KNICA
MSAALVRRGLELSADVCGGANEKKSKKQKVTKSSSSKRSSRAPPAGRHRASAKDRHVRSVLEEASRAPKDHSAQTLQYFLHSVASASSDSTAKIVRQNSGRQSKSRAGAPAQKPQEPKSVFTEEEFQQFQKEYFGRAVEEQ